MKEKEWLSSENPARMLEFLLHSDRRLRFDATGARPALINKRKLRLFACACLDAADQRVVRASAESFDYGDEGGKIPESSLSGVCSEWAKACSYDPPQSYKAAVLREIMGNPFRKQKRVPRRLATKTIKAIAQAIYDEGRFQEMPVLADALEDAGCDDEFLLMHLRNNAEKWPGEWQGGVTHVRGCWALDLVLGLE